MRWATLYAKSRQAPRSLITAVAAVALACLLWTTFSNNPVINDRLVLVAVMLGTAALGLTLGTVDAQLDRTASLNWPVRRALHLLLALAVLTVLMLATQLTPVPFQPFSVILRNTVGLLGLTALGAVLVGSELCWLGSVVWTLICILPSSQPSSKVLAQVATWPVQAPDTTAAILSAVALAVAGATAYTYYGCPERAA